jgi:hypothetical protein
MDNDPVRIFLVLESKPTSWTWTPTTTRYIARNAMRDFAEGIEWEGSRVIRALIVEVPD